MSDCPIINCENSDLSSIPEKYGKSDWKDFLGTPVILYHITSEQLTRDIGCPVGMDAKIMTLYYVHGKYISHVVTDME